MIPLEGKGHAVPQLKAIRYGIYERRGLSCGSAFSLQKTKDWMDFYKDKQTNNLQVRYTHIYKEEKSFDSQRAWTCVSLIRMSDH